MRFESELDTLMCDECGRLINVLHDEGFEDHSMCVGCRSRVIIAHQNSKCDVCKKKMGSEDYHYNMEDSDAVAHSTCVENLAEEDQEEWSDDFEY